MVLPFSFTYDMHIPLQQSWNFERPKKFVISKFTNRKAKVVLSAMYPKLDAP